jgi:peptidoglycan/LPS O-acetylase OafA/YrhL
MTDERSPDPHVRARAVLAFLIIFWLSLIVVTVLLVGALDFEPRAAATVAAMLAVLLSVSGAAHRPTRNFFSAIWMV